MLNAGTTGVIVNAGADDDVVLRGLDIVGGNETRRARRASTGGTNGIRVLGARSVRIENTQISNNAGAGIQIAPTASNPNVIVNRVDISNSCANGIQVAPAAGRDGRP